MSKSAFYHAGCPLCVGAEKELLNFVRPDTIDIIHLGEQKAKTVMQSKQVFNWCQRLLLLMG